MNIIINNKIHFLEIAKSFPPLFKINNNNTIHFNWIKKSMKKIY